MVNLDPDPPIAQGHTGTESAPNRSTWHRIGTESPGTSQKPITKGRTDLEAPHPNSAPWNDRHREWSDQLDITWRST
jgi:hypothetical protein